jgi:rubredoxin
MTDPSESNAAKWVCTSCGYIYDPATDDVEHGIERGKPFEQLPDSWKCPICYATKEAFDLL